MYVSLNISLPGISHKKRKAALELPEGTTIKQALAQYAEANKVPYNINNMRGIIAVCNDEPAKLSDVLKDGDDIQLIKPVRLG